jgi:hypothetical protein
MKRTAIASIMAALLSTTALADTSSMSTTATGMGVLENDYVKAGVNGTTGTLGSGGNTSPGLLYDSTGSGTFNTSYDYLTPGSPFDGWSIKIDGTNSTNNNNGNTASWTDSDGLTDGAGTLTWTGTNSAHSGWEVENTYTLGATAEHIEIGTQITAGSDATALSFGRFIDPDARAASGDSSSTDNVLGYGVIPDTNVAFSEALASRYALGLYSTDSNVDAGITGWTTEADGYTENAFDSSSNTNTGDNTIGLSWNWSSVSTGDILTASYAYIFGPSAFDAADAAITAGAGGGADTSSWGTLEDVGSATDAADGAAEPTVTSTSDPVTTYGTWGDWAHDADLPVLTQAQTTHDSSVAAGVQTIARETTTIVTTPEERSRTSTTSVVDTYSDSSTVTRTTATGTDTETRNNAVSTVTDPGAFVGRMDQADQMLGLNAHRNLGIGNGISGSRITHDMGNGYSAESNVLSLGGNTVLDNGARVSAGLNRVNTTMTGEASSGTIETMILSGEVGKHIDSRDITITGNANIANGDMNYSRSIGDFDAAGATSNKDMWGGLTVEKSTGQVRPFAGITVGKKSTDAYDETGDVQATLSHAAVDETYRYGTLGFNLDTGIFTASISKDFGDSEAMRIGVGVDRAINDRISIGVDASRITDGDNTSNRLSAGIKIQF